MQVEPEIQRARRIIAEMAGKMLDGSISFIEGARVIWRLGSDAHLSEHDPDLRVLLGIDSATDALPVGSIRDLWASTALERLQPDIDRAEAWASSFGNAACRSLVCRFGASGIDA